MPVLLNITHRKFICIDKLATEKYEFIGVGNIYSEAIVDVNGDMINPNCDFNKIFVLLLVYGQPFYVERSLVCRIDQENDSTRKVIAGMKIFQN